MNAPLNPFQQWILRQLLKANPHVRRPNQVDKPPQTPEDREQRIAAAQAKRERRRARNTGQAIESAAGKLAAAAQLRNKN